MGAGLYLTRSFPFDLDPRTGCATTCFWLLALPDGRPVAGALNFHSGAERALRPLLGLHRASPLPAFRFVLTIRRSISPSGPWSVSRVEGRRAGHAQAGARLHAGADPFAALGARSRALPRPSRATSRPRREAVDEEIEVMTGYGPFNTEHRWRSRTDASAQAGRVRTGDKARRSAGRDMGWTMVERAREAITKRFVFGDFKRGLRLE